MFESTLALAAPQFIFLGMQVPPAYTVREILQKKEEDEDEDARDPPPGHHALQLHESFNTYLRFSMIWFLLTIILVLNRFGWIGIPFIITTNLFYMYLVYYVYHREVNNSHIDDKMAVKKYFKSAFGPKLWMDMNDNSPVPDKDDESKGQDRPLTSV